MKHILLLEDDLSDALHIELILDEMSDVTLTHVTNLTDAEKALSKQKPDVILADLMLDNGEISLDWPNLKNNIIPVILLTYNFNDSYYQQAKQIGATAYLIKPANPITLRFELERILNLEAKAASNKVVIKDGTKLHVFDNHEIISIRTEGNYSTVHSSSRKVVIKTSLLKIINQVSQTDFIRIHRSAIVAINNIKMIDSASDTVILDDGSALPLGKTYKSNVKLRLYEFGIQL